MGKEKKPEVVTKVNKKASPEIAKTKYVVAPNGKRVPVGGQKSRDIIKAHEASQKKSPVKVDLTKAKKTGKEKNSQKSQGTT